MNWLNPFREILEEGRPLAPLTTFKVGGCAQIFLRPGSAREVALLLEAIKSEGLPFRILGGGANLLIEDGEHACPILHLDRLDGVSWHDDGVVRVEGGFPFLKLVHESVRRGWQGLEGLAGIPGQMGGICVMNAGGRWGEIKDWIHRVEVARADGEVYQLDAEACGFAYRSSAIEGVVTAVELHLQQSPDPERTRAMLSGILRKKGAAQPLQLPSAGCCFTNPFGKAVGQLVEELGLKGHRLGDAAISEKHGNFIVNLGRARFEDVLGLLELVEEKVKEAFGLTLRREVEIWRRQV